MMLQTKAWNLNSQNHNALREKVLAFEWNKATSQLYVPSPYK